MKPLLIALLILFFPPASEAQRFTRLQANLGEAAVKSPVKVATTQNITLSGEQVIDGISVEQDDRVLVKNQTDTSKNGIYLVQRNKPWKRATDFDGIFDVTTGTFVRVLNGTLTGNHEYQLTTAEPIVIGTSNLTFSQVNLNNYNATYIDVTDFGAACNGTQDDTAYFESAASSALSGGATMLLPPSGTCLINDSVDISGSGSLRIQSLGAKIKYTKTAGNLFNINNVTDITLQDLIIDGDFTPAPSGGGTVGKAAYAQDCGSVTLRDSIITGMTSIRTERCNNVQVINNRIDSGLNPDTDPVFSETYNSNHSLSYGIFIRSSSNTIITGNDVNAFVTDCVKVSQDTSSNFGENHTIANNTLRNCRNDDGIDIFNSGAKITIMGNTIYRAANGINAKKGDAGSGNIVDTVNTISIVGNIINGASTATVNGHNSTAAQGGLQQGISVNSERTIVSSNQIRNIRGIGINIRELSYGVTLANNVVQYVWTTDDTDPTLGNGLTINRGADNTEIYGDRYMDTNNFGVYFNTDSFRWDGGTVAVNEVSPTRMIFINPDNDDPNGYGCYINNVFLLNRSADPIDYGIRVSGAVDEPCVINNTKTAGSFTDRFRDDTYPETTRGTGNPWQNNTFSSDNGDTDVNVTQNSSLVQLFETPLTASRTVSLPVDDIMYGTIITVQRGEGATGAYALSLTTSGTTVTNLDSAGSFADVFWNGEIWRLLRRGILQ